MVNYGRPGLLDPSVYDAIAGKVGVFVTRASGGK